MEIKTVISIDPGLKTGWALIDFNSEKPLSWGELKVKNNGFVDNLLIRFNMADFLIIEDQHLDMKIMNPLSVIRLAQTAGIIIGAWLLEKKGDRGSYTLVKASRWQKSLNLGPGAPRDRRKLASMLTARLLTGQKCGENASDALIMGTSTIRRLKAKEKGMIT